MTTTNSEMQNLKTEIAEIENEISSCQEDYGDAVRRENGEKH